MATIRNVKYTTPQAGGSSSTPGFVEGTVVVGGENTLLIADMTSRELLEGIFIELKKLNLRQDDSFENEIRDEDV